MQPSVALWSLLVGRQAKYVVLSYNKATSEDNNKNILHYDTSFLDFYPLGEWFSEK